MEQHEVISTYQRTIGLGLRRFFSILYDTPRYLIFLGRLIYWEQMYLFLSYIESYYIESYHVNYLSITFRSYHQEHTELVVSDVHLCLSILQALKLASTFQFPSLLDICLLNLT